MSRDYRDIFVYETVNYAFLAQQLLLVLAHFAFSSVLQVAFSSVVHFFAETSFFAQQASFFAGAFAAGLVSWALTLMVNKAIAKTVNNFFIFFNLLLQKI